MIDVLNEDITLNLFIKFQIFWKKKCLKIKGSEKCKKEDQKKTDERKKKRNKHFVKNRNCKKKNASFTFCTFRYFFYIIFVFLKKKRVFFLFEIN